MALNIHTITLFSAFAGLCSSLVSKRFEIDKHKEEILMGSIMFTFMTLNIMSAYCQHTWHSPKTIKIIKQHSEGDDYSLECVEQKQCHITRIDTSIKRNIIAAITTPILMGLLYYNGKCNGKCLFAKKPLIDSALTSILLENFFSVITSDIDDFLAKTQVTINQDEYFEINSQFESLHNE